MELVPNEQLSDVKQLDSLTQKTKLLKQEIGKIIIGQEEIVEQVLISIFSKGHCLLVGVPGLAKTLLVNTIAQALGLTYNRIQFTPDLMPSDITGNEVLDENEKLRNRVTVVPPPSQNLFKLEEEL